jgi:hypothetical protein
MIIFDKTAIAGTVLFPIPFLKTPRLTQLLKNSVQPLAEF